MPLKIEYDEVPDYGCAQKVNRMEPCAFNLMSSVSSSFQWACIKSSETDWGKQKMLICVGKKWCGMGKMGTEMAFRRRN